MKLWTTEIKAINPETGEMVDWSGPNVPGISLSDAQSYCNTHELGYCKVVGELVAEIAVSDGNCIDYDIINSN